MAEEKNIKQDNLVPIQDEIVLYQSEDGNIKVDVLFQDETVWLEGLLQTQEVKCYNLDVIISAMP